MKIGKNKLLKSSQIFLYIIIQLSFLTNIVKSNDNPYKSEGESIIVDNNKVNNNNQEEEEINGERLEILPQMKDDSYAKLVLEYDDKSKIKIDMNEKKDVQDHKGEGEVYYENGRTYKGELLNYIIPHGVGTMETSDDHRYSGDWKNGLPYGIGIYKKPNGDEYDGEILNQFPEGSGKMVYSNGTIYNGFWKKGLYQGKGNLDFGDDGHYDGNFHNGFYHGQGKLTFEDKSFYDGQFVLNKREGKGKYTAANGQSWYGNWIDDIPDIPGYKEKIEAMNKKRENKNDEDDDEDFSRYVNDGGDNIRDL